MSITSVKKRTHYEVDMTNGNFFKKIVLFCLPLMFTGILQLLYNAADLIVVGQFSDEPDALGAVGSTSALINLIINLFMGLSVGSNVMCARSFASKDANKLSKIVHTSITISVICGFVLGIVGFIFARNFLQMMDNPIDLAVVYLKIYFIDVGQGDSTLIVTPSKKTILIDGGGSESFDVGEKVLLPYLLDRRIRKIDYIMISHFDTDHCKGIFTVIENLKVKNIIISKQAEKSENYKKFKEIVANKKINIILVKAGDKIKIDKYIYFKILFPTEKLIMQNPLNNNSIVSQLNYKSFKMLFTGDIEEIAEKEILNLQKDKLKSTILKVAHHGSNTSSTQEFINSVKPELALIGVGKNNTFGHPSECVVEKLRDLRY